MSRIVLVLVLAFATSARAEKVDWSQYIDKNPSAPVKSTPVQIATPDKPAPAKSAKKTAAKPKPKARTKPKQRH